MKKLILLIAIALVTPHALGQSTTSQKVHYVVSALKKVLNGSKYKLNENSVDLERYAGNLYLGDSYKVTFIVLNSENDRTYSGRSYLWLFSKEELSNSNNTRVVTTDAITGNNLVMVLSKKAEPMWADEDVDLAGFNLFLLR